ncbi:MAG: TIR domain-containing protein [Ruminococcaceae bacterium]|nr:TIR domain-containing protein [Oscillospiraceae bacterium]
MAILKCKMCGGDLVLTGGSTIAECEYCGSIQTLPAVDDEKKLALFARANRLRMACYFDKAAGIYETIVTEFPEEAEAYWGLVLCKYGIEYVDDPITGKKIPTCHRSSFDSIMDDSDFEQVLENADTAARKVYREEAKQIEAIRKGIIAVSANEEPYDIFLCYKETAENGDRTWDSVLAQDVYDVLTDRGYRVFFSRITLEDKLGVEYEPYIFAALNSAKIMLVFGTDYEYFSAVWVKNEWSRFLKLMAKDKDKHLIPCYKGIDVYDMPKEFAKLQAQDMGKVGAVQDLLRGIEKLMPKKQNTATIVQERVIVGGSGNVETMLRRVYRFLEEEKWTAADECCERILDMDDENAAAYLGKLLAQFHVKKQEELISLGHAIENNVNYQKAMRYGDEALRKKLREYAEYAQKKEIYKRGYAHMSGRMVTAEAYKRAISEFEKISGWQDADQKIEICRQEIARLEEAREQKEQLKKQKRQKAKEKKIKVKTATSAKRGKMKIAIVLSVLAVLLICATALGLAEYGYRSIPAALYAGEISAQTAYEKMQQFKWYKEPDGCFKAWVNRLDKTLYPEVCNITELEIPADVAEISERAFAHLEKLERVIIADGVTNIDNNAFIDCKMLKTVVIPESVNSIGNNAFDSCTSLTELTIPNGVTNIGDGAFSDCSSLNKITIPKSVERMGFDVFAQCRQLKKIYCEAEKAGENWDSNWVCFYLEYNGSEWALPEWQENLEIIWGYTG